jgi:putative ABC transport system permease protein
MRSPLLAGRFPAAHSYGREALVNEEFAHRFFPGENPVGKQIDVGGPMEVVGLVGNTRLQGPIAATLPEVYWSTEYFTSPALLVRVAGSPESIAGAVREKLKRIEPEIRIGAVQPLSAEESERTALQRFTRSLLLIFAVLAVVLASLGIYGVVSYTVAQRTREIGIRMALGATRANVARLMLEQALGATVIGALAGAAGASLLAKFLTTQLYGVTMHDPSIYAAVIALISAVALAASAIPVLRASHIDPAACLRE